MKKYVMFIVSIFSFSQADAGISKCVDESGTIYYADHASKAGNELMSILACENISKNPSAKELQQRTQKLFEKKTDQERAETLARLNKTNALIHLEGEKASYRIKVRETARFLDDVEAARKRK